MIDPELMAILVCPRCHAGLAEDVPAQELHCTGPQCGLVYPVRDGIPVLLVDQARPAGGDASGDDVETDR
jgi:uncharacterized protein YbaR (Trm112 family)